MMKGMTEKSAVELFTPFGEDVVNNCSYLRAGREHFVGELRKTSVFVFLGLVADNLRFLDGL